MRRRWLERLLRSDSIVVLLAMGCKQEQHAPPKPAPVDAGPPLVLAVDAPAPPLDAVVAEPVDAGPKTVDAAVAELSPEAVRTFIESRAPYVVEKCAAKATELKIAAVTVTVTVASDGRPSNYLWKQFGPLQLCVQNEVGQWRLPRAPKGGSAEVTIRFP